MRTTPNGRRPIPSKRTAVEPGSLVACNGSFHIDDMPAGKYVLNVHFSQYPAGRLSNYRFSVPETAGGEPAPPLDLGVLTLDR